MGRGNVLRNAARAFQEESIHRTKVRMLSDDILDSGTVCDSAYIATTTQTLYWQSPMRQYIAAHVYLENSETIRGS
jgi:hypothetical protein